MEALNILQVPLSYNNDKQLKYTSSHLNNRPRYQSRKGCTFSPRPWRYFPDYGRQTFPNTKSQKHFHGLRLPSASYTSQIKCRYQ